MYFLHNIYSLNFKIDNFKDIYLRSFQVCVLLCVRYVYTCVIRL